MTVVPSSNTQFEFRCIIELGVLHLDQEAVLDWLYEVDKFFDIMDVPEEEQVKIVANKLRGGARAWWQNKQDNRRRQGKYLITMWPRMK
jgi:hypothetical protein